MALSLFTAFPGKVAYYPSRSSASISLDMYVLINTKYLIYKSNTYTFETVNEAYEQIELHSEN